MGRRIAAWQDIRLFGRDFILLQNSTYGAWLRALEANSLGAGDELAYTKDQVRKGLTEPRAAFSYQGDSGPDRKKPSGPKLGDNVAVWDGDQTVSIRKT